MDQSINTSPERKLKYLNSSTDNDEQVIGILKIKEIIDKTTNLIFISYREKLLSEPIIYIVQAVWGKKQGKFTPCQREINNKVAPMISDIMEIFEFEEISEAQKFGIEYLIRGLVISKVTYLIEAFKNREKEDINSVEWDYDLLDILEPLGNA